MKIMLRKTDFHVKEIEDTEMIHKRVRQSGLGVITEWQADRSGHV